MLRTSAPLIGALGVREATRVPDILKDLRKAFPTFPIEKIVANHPCAECDSLNRALVGNPWDEVPSRFIDENAGALPLISDDTYLEVLPAWLARAVEGPGSDVATMTLINLTDNPRTAAVTRAQAKCIIEVAHRIIEANGFGPEDPANIESLNQVEKYWGIHVRE